MYRRSKRLCGLLSILFLTALAGAVQGQSTDSPEYFMSIRYTLNPGTMREFRHFVINEWNPTAKKGGLTERHFWREMAGDGDVVHMGNPTTLASYDGPTYVERAFGDDETGLEKFRENVTRFIAKRELSILTVQSELTYIPARAEPLALAEMYLYDVVRGQDWAVEESLTILAEAAKKSGHGRWVGRRTYGGSAGEVVSLTLYESFADLAKGNPLQRAANPENAAKFEQMIQPSIDNVRRYLITYDAEMSFAPGASSSQEP